MKYSEASTAIIIRGTAAQVRMLNHRLPKGMVAIPLLHRVEGMLFDVIILACELVSNKEYDWFQEAVRSRLNPNGVVIER